MGIVRCCYLFTPLQKPRKKGGPLKARGFNRPLMPGGRREGFYRGGERGLIPPPMQPVSQAGGSCGVNPAQMAATLVEVIRHILRITLHATSVRNELSEVGALLEDVVADFGRLWKHEMTSLQRLTSSTTSSSTMTPRGTTSPWTRPARDSQEGFRCAVQLLAVLETAFPGATNNDGPCDGDSIWLHLRGERLGEFIVGMNIPAPQPLLQRSGGDEDQRPYWRGPAIRHDRDDSPQADPKEDREASLVNDITVLVHTGNYQRVNNKDALEEEENRRELQQEGDNWSFASATSAPPTTSTTTTPLRIDAEAARGATTTGGPKDARSRSPLPFGNEEPTALPRTQGNESTTPSPVRRARSQASALLQSLSQEH